MGLHHSDGLLTATLLRGGEPALTAEYACESPVPGIAAAISALLDEAGADVNAISTVTLGGLLEPEHVLSAELSLLLITTEGFSDVLILGRQRRWALYDNSRDRPQPLVPRHRTIGAVERMLADGAVHKALDESRLRADLARWKDEVVDAIAISFLHSYANDAHERRAAEIVTETLPGIPVSCSAQLAPVVREYERTATTVIDAACAALFTKRISESVAEINALGIEAPVRLATSQGMALPLDGAQRRPALILGGGHSAAGTAAARGTSPGSGARLALLVTGSQARLLPLEVTEPRLSDQGEIGMDDNQPFSGWPVALPAAWGIALGDGLATRVGAWMESLAWGNRVPEPSATLADAMAVAGWLAGGPESAERLRVAVAEPLGLELEEAASATLEVVVASFAEAARLRLVGDGAKPEDATLIAVGKWAPALVPAVALHLGCRSLIVPVEALASSALGAAIAATGLEQVAAAQLHFGPVVIPQLETLFHRLRKAAQKATGLKGSNETRTVKLRVHGGGIELACALPETPLDADALESVRRDFFALHRAQHPDHSLDPQASLVVSAVRLRLVEPDLRTLPEKCAVPHKKPRGRSLLFSNGDAREVRFMAWSDLPPSGAVDGPLVVVLNGSELIVPPGSRVGRHSGGTLVVSR